MSSLKFNFFIIFLKSDAKTRYYHGLSRFIDQKHDPA